MVTAEDRQRLRREKTREAINLALQSQWEQAAEANRAVLQYFPDDVDAHTRLGKALMEMGQLEAARASLTEALKRDSHNQIVKRNMDRLATMQSSRPAGNHRGSHRLDPRFFIEQSGKSGITNLTSLAPVAVLAQVSAGDPVRLRTAGGRLIAESAEGVYLGRVEPKIAARLMPLIHGGNRYEAAVVSVEDKELSIIIREVWQHPSQSHTPSFPVKVADDRKGSLNEAPAAEESEEGEEAEEGEEEDSADAAEGDEEQDGDWAADAEDDTEKPGFISEVDEESTSPKDR